MEAADCIVMEFGEGMVSKLKKGRQNWTYEAASKTLPYVRLILGNLRERFVTIWHLYRVAGYDVANPDYREQARILGGEAKADLQELGRLGIVAFDSPLRGIALFPFLLQDSHGGTSQKAFFVYMDSRDRIDTYIQDDALCTHCDLPGYERPVPEAWKEPGAVLKLSQERRR